MIHATFPCAGEGCPATVIQPVQGNRYRKCADCRRVVKRARDRRAEHAMRQRLRRVTLDGKRKWVV